RLGTIRRIESHNCYCKYSCQRSLDKRCGPFLFEEIMGARLGALATCPRGFPACRGPRGAVQWAGLCFCFQEPAMQRRQIIQWGAASLAAPAFMAQAQNFPN